MRKIKDVGWRVTRDVGVLEMAWSGKILRTAVQQKGKVYWKRTPLKKGPETGVGVAGVKSRKASMTRACREPNRVGPLSQTKGLGLILVAAGSH